MPIFRDPEWIKQYYYPFAKYEDIPQTVFDEINERLDKLQSPEPLVSIVITAWNEEVDLLKTIGSLSAMKTNYPLEIIVVNNNSTDHTQDTLDRLHLKNFFQPIQGWGPGRQMGMENARGKYILMADSDCIYPDCWVNNMISKLSEPGVVCVYGRYSFISEKGFSRWQLTILEVLKDLIAEVRHIKRPFLNCYGMSMGYIRELGLKEGYYMNRFRGEDGRMCYDLMKYGKVKQVRSSENRLWTSVRTLKQSGSFNNALKIRLLKEIKRFSIYFNKRMKILLPKDQQPNP